MENKIYDCIIIGGGIAGLSLSILMAKQNRSVLLIEKKEYPYHKVCGEYISMESWNFLVELGIDLPNLNLPIINQFQMTSTNGLEINTQLDLGGFGISRYTLDKLLADKAIEVGVNVMTQTTCYQYKKKENVFCVKTSSGNYQSKILCASFGRHSFGNFNKPNKISENWVGIKYHIQTDFPTNKVALHTFKNGYCGISKVDDNKYCLCYLVKAKLLNKYKNNIPELEKNELYKNPYLKKIFINATFINSKPFTISNITFGAKKPVADDVIYLGDSAGTIVPLTGNGMSNALRSAWILSDELNLFYNSKINFKHLKINYQKKWDTEFLFRIKIGKIIQQLVCNQFLTNILLLFIKKSRLLTNFIISKTHGKTF